MALLFFDSFDNYGTAISTQVPAGCWERRYPLPGRSAGRVTVPRIPNNGRGFGGDYSHVWMTPILPVSGDTIVAGFAYRQGDGDVISGVSAMLLGFNSGGTRGLYIYFESVAGELSVWRDESTDVVLGRTTGARVALHRWNYIELKVRCHATEGTVEVRVNGKTRLTLTNVNTLGNGVTSYNRFGVNPFGSNYAPWYDDFYICDGSGAAANDFLGPVKAVTLRPVADVAGASWTLQSGSDHYAMVDEAVANDNTDYIETDVAGSMDLFEYEDAPANIGTIHGVNLCTEFMATDSEVFTLYTPAKLVSQSDGTAETVGGAAYQTAPRLLARGPGGYAWTKDNLDDTQFGVKLA